MNFNISKVLGLLNGISNPKQAINMMLNKMPQDKANMLRNMMNSGKDPKQAILDSARNGQINLDQLNQAKTMFQTVRKLGFRKFNVPDSLWSEAEDTRALITQNTIDDLRDRLNSARDQLGNLQQTASIIAAVRPFPIPAYPTCSPYTAYGNYGWNNGYNGCNGCGNI